MALEELNEKLHGRDVHVGRTRPRDFFRPDENASTEETVSQFQATERWGEDSLPPKSPVPEMVQSVVFPDAHSKKRRKIVVFLLGGLALLLLVGGIVLKLRTGIFSEENIVIALIGEAEAKSAEAVSFDFEYANNNWTDVRQAIVVFEYPDSFHPEPLEKLVIKKSRAEYALGDIAAQAKGKITLQGKFFGSASERAKLQATLRYSPQAFSTTYEKKTEHVVTIVSSSFLLEIEAPQELASDHELEYSIHYKNQGTTTATNLRVQLEYPVEFTFIEANPKPASGENLWHIDTLPPQDEGRITVRGRLIGGRDEQKLVKGKIGIMQGDGTFLTYTEHSRQTKMVASPFAIHQTVNGGTGSNVNPGESLQYEIEYRNEGNVGIRDAIISMSLDSPYLDFRTLQFSGVGFKGAYNPSQKIIFWKASDVPALSRVEPGQSGKVSFTVGVFVDLTKRFPDVRNPVIRSVAKIDSPDIPSITGAVRVVASTTLELKVNSLVTHTVSGRYFDAVIPNSGPLPPVVGQETTYTFQLSFANALNEVRDGRVSVMLPSGIRFTGQKNPDSEALTYNERTNELVWNIGTFAPVSTRALLFQVAVTPNLSDVGNRVLLISRAAFTGKDAFTQKDIRIDIGEQTNELRNDGEAFAKGSNVLSE